ncbi:pyridoxamine 5'-phosphate oxidase family protein [Brucella pituitosa]|uniref:pyridoxamine 5'-phosphate oxidase family protein n=1 Tax=Brucella pituitosa TaxID=571256 RepID=UPI0009A17885|nr:pyridoxamine 5'-phosphate oxidase family protein [Brucella pituitosa]
MTEITLPKIWQMLGQAMVERTPFTLMQLATIGNEGKPKLRTIVARRFDEATACLSFITDVRSPKVKEILDNPSVSLVAFDADASVQLRIDGIASIIEDEYRRQICWNMLHNHTHDLFHSSLPPGTAIPYATAETLENCDPELAYERFCLINIYLEYVEWLQISTLPHVRRSFIRESRGWMGSWIVP